MAKKSNFDKEEWLKQKEDEKEKIFSDIKTAIAEFQQDPDKLLEMLEFQSRFYRYSFNNTVLIFMQNPHASFVGSYPALAEIGKALAEKHGDKDVYYGVQKGAKSMQILVPKPVTYIKDDNGEWIQLSKADKQLQARHKHGEVESYKRLRFGIGNVFDIAQTTIPTEYYPEVIKDGFGTDSEKHKKLNNFLVRFCESHKDIEVMAMEGSSLFTRGYATSDNKIALNDRMKDTGYSSTLLHELGHNYMHFGEDAKGLTTAQKEVEADVFCILIAKHFGIDIPDTRMKHLVGNLNSLPKDKQDELLNKSLNTAASNFSKCVGEIEKFELTLGQEQVADITCGSVFEMSMA